MLLNSVVLRHLGTTATMAKTAGEWGARSNLKTDNLCLLVHFSVSTEVTANLLKTTLFGGGVFGGEGPLNDQCTLGAHLFVPPWPPCASRTHRVRAPNGKWSRTTRAYVIGRAHWRTVVGCARGASSRVDLSWLRSELHWSILKRKRKRMKEWEREVLRLPVKPALVGSFNRSY